MGGRVGITAWLALACVLPVLAQPPSLKLQVDPPEASLVVAGQPIEPQSGVYVLDQRYFGSHSQSVSVLLRCDGFRDQPLPDLTYRQLKQGNYSFRDKTIVLQPASPAGYQRRYPWLLPATIGGLLALASLALNTHRNARQRQRNANTLASLVAGADLKDPLIFSTLGRYRIVSQLGQGGMATVYKAVPEDNVDESEAVALKVIRPDQLNEEFQVRFEREIRVSMRLNHPNVVRVIDWGKEGEITYLVMELVHGKPLSKGIPPGGIGIAEAMPIISGVIEALAYAHSHGIVHRDLKPDNVMVTSASKVKLMDFGLARNREVKTVTVVGHAMGTPAYMAPEQVLNTPSRDALTDRSDQYSLAVLIYEVLTGRRPFENPDPMAIIMQHLNDPPPPISDFNPSIPRACESTLLRMLAKSPRDRFASVKEAGASLLLGSAHLAPTNAAALQALNAVGNPAAMNVETAEVPQK